ncbi:hypothetical protein HMPREF0185_01659 [Brevundimonas diminuta 470-4]|nr:hypothetical protein HMPREF0185_01659 [Brevundimonas diminuta 470-4]
MGRRNDLDLRSCNPLANLTISALFPSETRITLRPRDRLDDPSEGKRR